MFATISRLQSDQADTTSEQLKEVEPSPPPRIGAFVDEVYHKVGAANDIILVEGLDGTLSATDFNVSTERQEGERRRVRMGVRKKKLRRHDCTQTHMKRYERSGDK